MRILVGAFLLIFASNLLAENVSITWTLPTQREDGTEFKQSSIKHIDVYYSATGEDGAFSHAEKLLGINTAFTQEFESGEHCFYLTLTSTENLTSERSSIHCLKSKPEAPIIISIIIKIIGM